MSDRPKLYGGVPILGQGPMQPPPGAVECEMTLARLEMRFPPSFWRHQVDGVPFAVRANKVCAALEKMLAQAFSDLHSDEESQRGH